jgi:hypothetical protein
MSSYEVVCKDVIDWANEYDGPPFMALLCDAPYEMAFMSKSWDDSGVSFNPDTWRALAQHLYPGAFLFVFAGTINDDLISVAMRKAGLRKHHKMLNYSYGSGFPKSTKIERTFASGNSPFCQCDDSPLLSLPRDSRNNGRYGMNTAADSQERCSQDCRQDDAQPHGVLGSDQETAPLQADAQEHSRFDVPSLEIQQDNEPLHSPSEVQYSDRQHNDTCQDSQGLSGDASQLQQDRVSETCHACDSQQPSIRVNRNGQDSLLSYEGDNKKASHKHDNDNLDTVSPYAVGRPSLRAAISQTVS